MADSATSMKKEAILKRLTLFLGAAAVLFLVYACSNVTSLRSDQPIQPVEDFEAYLIGNLSAGYVGTENCLKACHEHDKIEKDFKLSVHGAQIDAATGLPLVNCESCHGPGSEAIEHARENNECDFDTLLQIDEFPSKAQSLVCLKCHSAASTPTLQHWSASTHANSDVSCYDCHDLHQGPQQKVPRDEMDDLCYKCHKDVKMAFNQFSHHPVPENKVSCIDCHNPHGTTQPKDLKGYTVRETCTRCHMGKQGPFIYEHADVTEDCTNCHRPHGSPNNPLLTTSQPFLCMQCHPGHNSDRRPGLVNGAVESGQTENFQQAFYSRCTDCHSAIHGTDVPSAHGRGSFIAR